MSKENFGLLEQGFYPKNLSTIIEENLSYFRELFGIDIDSTPMNPLVKVNEVFSRGLEKSWVQTGLLFDSKHIQNMGEYSLQAKAIEMGYPRKDGKKASGRLTFVKTGTRTVVIPVATVIDNNSELFLKEFETVEKVTLPIIFIIQKGAVGGTDVINSYSGFEDFFNIQSIEWVSDNIDGTSPYVPTTDYTFSVGNQWIDWSPGGSEPTTDDIYYVKVGEYSAYVDVEAKEVGSAYNSQINEVYNMQSPIVGIAKVTNDDAILNGRNIETLTSLRRRLLIAGNIIDNVDYIASYLNQLHRIDSAKVYDYGEKGHYRSLIYSTEDSNSALISIFNECLKEILLRKVGGTESVAIIRMVQGGAAPQVDQFPAPYSQTKGVSGTWKIEWVSDNIDGSSPYISGTDYDAYLEFDNEISWTGGGSNPGNGNQYYVKLIRVVEIAETFPITINGRLSLKQGYTLNDVSNDLFITLNDYINTNGISSVLYMSELSKIINSHPGVTYLDNLYLTVTMRLYMDSADGTDTLYLNGSGNTDYSNNDIVWVSDNKDGSSPYTVTTDYLWSIAASSRGINWSPGGSEPTVDYPYWTKVNIKGDILTPDDVIPILEGVDFTI
jgi:uncharacterized phage protein gp47/JayE